ncbi:hypothetical protein [Roseateles oligotrophus]|uniref:ABC-2 type transport system permease protein n=1 Tax=Roseateles oligotrophus TaxID=1769250 RepID=A0ABT2YMI8_9BURK|nr:hypothetical protein [Roseateles oligotrophus]MCV2371095.1 hypothetical protein [Roseateles oligotrophus]
MGAATEVNRLPVQARPLGLLALRLRWSAAELKALLRRWGAFIGVVAAVLGQFFATLIGWPALPLFWASQQAWPVAAWVLLLHALPGLLLCWGLREQLLPAHWLDAERALPLRRRQLLTADLAVITLALLPLALLYLISVGAWLYADPAWMRGLWPAALANFAISLALSVLGAAALMQARRRPRQAASAAPHRPSPSTSPSASARTQHSFGRNWVLLGLPLWRGPARPVMHLLLLACLALAACLSAAWRWPQQASWALAAYTLLAMGLSARLHAQATRCYAPIEQACAALPLAPKFWSRRLMLLALTPALLAWFGLALLLLLGPWQLAPLAAPLFMAYGLLAPALPLLADKGGSPESHAGRWLLGWALWVALASEALLAMPS